MRQKSTERRNAILQAAFNTVCARGYYETRIDDVARAAGVAKGTVYLYFKDKPDLYVGVTVWLINQARTIIKDIARQQCSPSAKLQQVFSSWVEHLLSRPTAISLIFPEMNYHHCAITPRFRQRVMPELKKLIDDLSALVRDGIQKGEFRKIDPHLAAISFLGAFHAALLGVSRYLGGKNTPERALDIFFYGIRRSV